MIACFKKLKMAVNEIAKDIWSIIFEIYQNPEPAFERQKLIKFSTYSQTAPNNEGVNNL
jgi:hypothetical protein